MSSYKRGTRAAMSPTERSLARIYDRLRKSSQRSRFWSGHFMYMKGVKGALDAVQAEFDKPIDWNVMP